MSIYYNLLHCNPFLAIGHLTLAPRGAGARSRNFNTRAPNDYNEETASERHVNPEAGFQSGSGGSFDATLHDSYLI